MAASEKAEKNRDFVVMCGARCEYQEGGYCKKINDPIAVVIGIDTKCIKFETSEKK